MTSTHVAGLVCVALILIAHEITIMLGMTHVRDRYTCGRTRVCGAYTQGTSKYMCTWDFVYRVAKTHRIPYLYRLFSAKETYI